MNYKVSAEYIIQRYKNDVAYANSLLENALSSNKILRDIDGEYKNYILSVAKGGKIDKKAMGLVEKKRKSVLDSIGLTQDVLSPKPHCNICNDTAFVGGKFCECVKKLSIDKENLIELTLHNFSDANFNLYDNDSKPRNELIFSNIKKISSLYPNNKKRVITLLGATGTGKTFLASCMANEMLAKGMSVTALTAFGFVNRVLSYHTTFNEKKLGYLAPLLDSNLLIIDDIGTESILKNVTLEYLYMILSERINSNKLTLFTTNLSKDGILSRYGERIYSRIFDKSLGYNAILGGNDIRLGQ